MEPFEVEQWYAVFALASNPGVIVARLHKEFAAAVTSSETVAQLPASGSEAFGNSPAELSALTRTETDRWRRIIREASIKVE